MTIMANQPTLSLSQVVKLLILRQADVTRSVMGPAMLDLDVKSTGSGASVICTGVSTPIDGFTNASFRVILYQQVQSLDGFADERLFSYRW